MKMKRVVVLLSLLNLVLSLDCRPNCEICEPLFGCLRCQNGNWGSQCQFTCQCEDACDVNTGQCITYTDKHSDIKDISGVPFIMVGIIAVLVLGSFIYKIIKYKKSILPVNNIP